MKNAPSLIDILNNPEHREMLETIEDILSSLENRDGDTMLEDALAYQIAELKKASGYTYTVEA